MTVRRVGIRGFDAGVPRTKPSGTFKPSDGDV